MIKKYERCKDCEYWRCKGDYYNDNVCTPLDEDTFEPKKMPFTVKECCHPDLMFCERPLDRNGFAVYDGSGYIASLYTAENFGCTKFKKRKEKK